MEEGACHGDVHVVVPGDGGGRGEGVAAEESRVLFRLTRLAFGLVVVGVVVAVVCELLMQEVDVRAEGDGRGGADTAALGGVAGLLCSGGVVQEVSCAAVGAA